MFILTQGGEAIVKLENISIKQDCYAIPDTENDSCKTVTVYIIVNTTNNGTVVELGEYGTVREAQSIINDIYHSIVTDKLRFKMPVSKTLEKLS